MELVIGPMQESIIKQLQQVNYPKGLSKIARDMFAATSNNMQTM